MYSQQYPQFPQTGLQQVVDDVSGPLYHQQQVNLPPPTYPSQGTTNGNDYKINTDAYALGFQPPEPSTSTNKPTIFQLAEFMTNMIYLLWHTRQSTVLALHTASTHSNFTCSTRVDPGNNLGLLSKGSNTAFYTFCQQVLTATQLSESVTILGLKYIARLLETNPHIQGAHGSEYRLFIVALMLANKFHDDNTFTNKSWSDISGMKLHELNVMEVEFLSALDFRLFVRKEEFDHWKTGLLDYMAQLQNATLMQEQQQIINSTIHSAGLYLPSASDPTWDNNNTALAQQQQQQYLYLLSTTAQPEFQTQLLNTPVARVPLRIPPYPVYVPGSSASSTASIPPSQPSSSTLSPYYPQNYTNSNPLTEPSFTQRPPTRSPHPNHPTPGRSYIPRNYSAPYLTPLNNNDNNAARYSGLGDHHHHHHHRAYKPYQRPSTHSDDQHPFIDHYGSNAGKMNIGPPINNDRPTLQQQRSTRLRSYSNPSPSHLGQQTTKPYHHQQYRQPSHDYIYQHYQQTGTGPQHDRHQQQRYR